MKHITVALLASSVVLSGCIVAAPTPQVIVITATQMPATATARPTARPTITPRPAHQTRQAFDPGPSWERTTWLDSSCSDADRNCSAWMFKDQELIAAVYDVGIGFTIMLNGTGDAAKEGNAIQSAASQYGVSDAVIFAAIDSAARATGNGYDDSQIVGDWAWGVSISDEYLLIVFLFGPDAINSSGGDSDAGSAQG